MGYQKYQVSEISGIRTIWGFIFILQRSFGQNIFFLQFYIFSADFLKIKYRHLGQNRTQEAKLEAANLLDF